MGFGFYAADTAMLLLAVLAALSAFREQGRRVIARRHLLLPGVLAALSTTALVAYPELRDLLELQRWTVGTAAFLVGVVRGSLLAMQSDHVFRLVRLERPLDSVVVAGVQVLLAALQFATEIRTGAESRFEPTVEALMTLTASYLLGRSVAGWIRALMVVHFDLGEE